MGMVRGFGRGGAMVLGGANHDWGENAGSGGGFGRVGFVSSVACAGRTWWFCVRGEPAKLTGWSMGVCVGPFGLRYWFWALSCASIRHRIFGKSIRCIEVRVGRARPRFLGISQLCSLNFVSLLACCMLMCLTRHTPVSAARFFSASR